MIAAMIGLLAEVHHHAEGVPVLVEYWDLITNLSHWMFEATTDVVFGFLLYPLAQKVWNRKVKEHDEEFHPLSVPVSQTGEQVEAHSSVLLSPPQQEGPVPGVRYVEGEVERYCAGCGKPMTVNEEVQFMWCINGDCADSWKRRTVLLREKEPDDG